MNLQEKEILERAEAYVKSMFSNESTGHDYFHAIRVCRTAVKIAEMEKADRFMVSLAALLHDVDDRKISPETYEKKENAVRFLRDHEISEELVQKILKMISEVSFNGSDSVKPSSIEGCCVQDADRLDALGAIGIARTFAYGGSHGRLLYDPSEKPALNMTGEEYKNHVSTSVNHFYEKLFLLKGMMTTGYGRELAEKREAFMKAYLEEFFQEWDG